MVILKISFDHKIGFADRKYAILYICSFVRRRLNPSGYQGTRQYYVTFKKICVHFKCSFFHINR